MAPMDKPQDGNDSGEKGAAPAADPAPVSGADGQPGADDSRFFPGEGQERLRRLLGDEGLARLAQARVLVIGVGGVGSNCAEALVRGGVGALAVCDGDVVAPSNLNRQAIAFLSTLGRPKVEVMAAMAADINPACVVDPYFEFCEAATVDAFLDRVGPVDWVVDACDMVSTKLALAEACQRRDQPLIASMGGANKLHPESITITTLEKTVNDPLARVMRKEARKRGIKGLLVASSDELPVAVAPAPGASRRDRSDLGTASFFPPVMGQIIAAEVIRRICDLDGGR